MLPAVGIIAVLTIACLGLNVYAARAVGSSRLFSERQKRFLQILIWALPFFALLPLVVINQAGRAAPVAAKPQLDMALGWERLDREGGAFVKARQHEHGLCGGRCGLEVEPSLYVKQSSGR